MSELNNMLCWCGLQDEYGTMMSDVAAELDLYEHKSEEELLELIQLNKEALMQCIIRSQILTVQLNSSHQDAKVLAGIAKMADDKGDLDETH